MCEGGGYYSSVFYLIQSSNFEKKEKDTQTQVRDLGVFFFVMIRIFKFFGTVVCLFVVKIFTHR